MIGVPDEKWGEAVKAVVVPAAGAAPTAEDLIAFARERLGRLQAAQVGRLRHELPRNPSGKLLKRAATRAVLGGCRPPDRLSARDRHVRMEILASRMLIRPADYERSLTFYRDEIGLAIARDYGAGTVFYAGQSLIEIAGHGTPSAGGTMWLQVRDVYATEKELAGRGVPIDREARQEPWGLHEMHVTDPDGVLLIFVQVPETHPLRRDNRQ